MPNVKAGLERNYALSRQPNFAKWMIKYLAEIQPEVVRIHCSGDFYSEAYLRKWLEIVRCNPKSVFFVYTRSWRNRKGERSDMISSILTLSRQPNVRLWLSADAETGSPPQWKSTRIAYLKADDDDHPAFPVDLLFRDKPKTEMKFDPVVGTLVCPNEQGLASSKKLQCAKCQLCYAKEKRLWKSLVVGRGRLRGGLGRSRKRIASKRRRGLTLPVLT